MSGLMLDITYNDLFNYVADWLVTNCHNVGTMRLPSCFQSNYSRTTTVNGAGSSYKPSYTIKPKTYAILVSKATVISELKSFYTDRGITNFASVIYDNNFMACMNNLVSFISSKVCFVASPYVSATDTISGSTGTTTFGNPGCYIAYFSTNNTFTNLEPMSSENKNEKVVLASDIEQIGKILMDTINNKLHTKQINYTVTFN